MEGKRKRRGREGRKDKGKRRKKNKKDSIPPFPSTWDQTQGAYACQASVPLLSHTPAPASLNTRQELLLGRDRAPWVLCDLGEITPTSEPAVGTSKSIGRRLLSTLSVKLNEKKTRVSPESIRVRNQASRFLSRNV